MLVINEAQHAAPHWILNVFVADLVTIVGLSLSVVRALVLFSQFLKISVAAWIDKGIIIAMVLIYFLSEAASIGRKKKNQGFWGIGGGTLRTPWSNCYRTARPLRAQCRGGGLNKYSLDKLTISICWTHTHRCFNTHQFYVSNSKTKNTTDTSELFFFTLVASR